MSGQDVFKGALGWDDWVWWSIIGGVGLFILLTLLCCCVCVQRAKRKGKAEALASVQARQREEQQREEAQVRYAQAQQARYGAPAPPPEQSFKYSQQHGGNNHRSGLHDHDFVAVTSPMGRDPTLNASTVSKMTLRDRIDALREGSVHDNHSRVSADAQDLEAPPIGAGRRSLVLAGTVLSENSPGSSASGSPRNQKAEEGHSLLHKTPYQVAFEEQTKFKTARSDYSSDDDEHSKLTSTSYSTGQFDDAESSRVHQTAATSNASSYTVDSTTQPAAATRARVKSSESTSSRGSVEF
uniref:Uncharacterized protein n=1 Tax=Globisporangium ultimum (strain ATCC 200006 / CBS 805.95 / DAOM BR144) TaxID=431595 RepID=K3WD39_GLOUD